MKRFKRLLSILLITAMILPMIPIGEIRAYAAEVNTITYTYKEGIGNESNLESIFMRLEVKISTAGSHDVTITADGGSPQNVGKITVDASEVNIPTWKNIWINNPKGNIRINDIYIGNFSITGLSSAPKITEIRTYDINKGDRLKFIGEGLNKGSIKVSGEEDLFVEINEAGKFEAEVKGTTGYKGISFEMGGKAIQKVNYPNSFKLLGDLSILGDPLEMTPQAGTSGSYVYIIARNGRFTIKNGEVMHSVFFLKDGIDPYSQGNMAEIVSHSQDGNVIKVRIPAGLEDSHLYEVQVTNKITNPKGNIYEEIVERKDANVKFRAIGSDRSPVISGVSPSKGPDAGEVVTISGLRFNELGFISDFGVEDAILKKTELTGMKVTRDKKKLDSVIGDIIDSEGIKTEEEEEVLKLSYKVEDVDGLKYGGKDVKNIDRYLATYIGNKTVPQNIGEEPGFEFTTGLDKISVNTLDSTIEKEKEVNVILIMQTEIKTADDIVHKLVNVISNEDKKYTIQPSFLMPTITKVVPRQIQVVKAEVVSGEQKYKFEGDMVIGIDGKDFQVIRNKGITNYPTIGIGAQVGNNSDNGIVVRVNPGKEGEIQIQKGSSGWEALPGASITVLNDKGQIIDGTDEKDKGNKIVLTLPKSAGIRLSLDSVTINEDQQKPQDVYIYNPVMGSDDLREPATNPSQRITFVDIGTELFPPTIESVTPNVVAIDSGEEIVIKGLGIEKGAKVFIGGYEVPFVEEELDGGGKYILLKFPAPKFPQIIAGSTKIMVLNTDGGLAVKDFTYVTSAEKDPILSDFTPKSGSENTQVVVDGDNFVVPNPSITNISGMGIYRLIGSRILMDGKDINEYNMDGNGSIELEKYENPTNLIFANGGIAELRDHAHSVVLVDGAGNFYTISTNNRDDIILSDGGSGTDNVNIMNNYEISFNSATSNFVASKGGQTYTILQDKNGLTLTGTGGEKLTLEMQTPYKFNGADIYGSRVHVKDKNRIEFRVPDLASKIPDGYTITVENPDTKKSTAKDLFYFYETVLKKPTISKINPSMGTIEGGYQVLIQGEDFEDGSKVYVDNVLVPQNNIKRKTIDGKDTLVIEVMPAFGRDMNQETGRKMVPITVENGDGGTAIGRFTYITQPSASPKIISAEFLKEKQVGSAAGGEILDITGDYFKFDEPNAKTPKFKGWIEGEKDGKTIYFEDLDEDKEYTSYENSREYDGDREKLALPIDTYTDALISPVLPKVRIGGIEAKIVEFGAKYIKVVTPQVTAGRHDLYVVNNDYGTSNKVVLNFEGSNVKIDDITPEVGKKQGKDYVEILGSGFQNSTMTVIENGSKKQYTMPTVRFGTIGGTKDINNNMTQVSLEKGDFNLSYNNTNPSNAEITLTAKVEKEIYTKIFNIGSYNGGEIFLPMGELKDSGGKSHPGYELVKVKTEGRKLIVEKGYSPKTKLDNQGKISLDTPSYYTIGSVTVTITNSDGGNASGKFRYTNPDSKPRIDNITNGGKDPVDGDNGDKKVIKLYYKNEHDIVVSGEDFREDLEIKVSNAIPPIKNDAITITKGIDEKTGKELQYLKFKIPAVSEAVVDRDEQYLLTVINGDGATAISNKTDNRWGVPIYIQFIKGESEPELGNITPDRGPATGGTKVTITGKDFRETIDGYKDGVLTVTFGEDIEVPLKDIKVIDSTTLEVIVPESPVLGEVGVTIKNPDGTTTGGELKFTYISKPVIEDMDPKVLFNNDTETVVTITGQQFLTGAKVIVGGKLILTKDVKDDMTLNGSGIRGVDSSGNNIESSVVDGQETATAIVEDDGTIKITFGQATDLENTSIIIINPDGGISEPYNDFRYEDPVPLKPMVLEGIPGYESTVMLIWNKSDPKILNAATKYEIYGRKTSDKTNTFIGDTKSAEFLVKSLEENTEYEFLVRALNQHGAAIDFATVKVKTLSGGEDKKLKEKQEKAKEEQKKIKTNGKEEMQNGRLVITLGTSKFKKGLGSLDISLSKYKDKDKFTIAIPIELARVDNQLTIKDGTMTSVLNVRDLYTLPISRLDIGDKDAYLRIHIDRSVEQHIPRGKKAASKAYGFEFDYIYGKDLVKINEILRNGKLSLAQDTVMYPTKKNTAIYVFDVETGNYVNAKTMNTDIKGKKKVILLSDR